MGTKGAQSSEVGSRRTAARSKMAPTSFRLCSLSLAALAIGLCVCGMADSGLSPEAIVPEMDLVQAFDDEVPDMLNAITQAVGVDAAAADDDDEAQAEEHQEQSTVMLGVQDDVAAVETDKKYKLNKNLFSMNPHKQFSKKQWGFINKHLGNLNEHIPEHVEIDKYKRVQPTFPSKNRHFFMGYKPNYDEGKVCEEAGTYLCSDGTCSASCGTASPNDPVIINHPVVPGTPV